MKRVRLCERLIAYTGYVFLGVLLHASCGAEFTWADDVQASGTHHAEAEPARQWRVCEFDFVAVQDYARPFDSNTISLTALFEGPDGERLEVPGFWDGDRTWRLRFTPTRPGSWSYTTRCSNKEDSGLHNRQHCFVVKEPAGDNPLHRHGGILRVSEDRRYLTYADGTPFFWLGDTWWFCPSALVPIDGSSQPECPSTFRTLIDTRAKQRFTVVQMCFLGPPQIAPGLNDFILLHPESWKPAHVAYWQQVDRYIRYANDAGILPVVGMTFHRSADSVQLEEFKTLWHYVLARYGAMPMGMLIQGEYNLKQGPIDERVEKVLALGEYLKQTDPYRRALTVHPWYHKGDEHQAWDQPWYDFIMLQGGHGRQGPPAEFYRNVYNHQPNKPLLEGECTYEGIHGYDAAVVRYNAYKAIQCGSFGYTYGSHGLWYPNQNAEDQKFDNWGTPVPWWEALRRPGGEQMKHLRACYESVDWWKLHPQADAVCPQGDVLVRADDTKTFLVYFVGDGKLSDDARLRHVTSGTSYKGTWFDPRTGEKNNVDEKLVADPTGLRLPSPPDKQDWILILCEAYTAP